MDVLSDVLSAFRLQGRVFCRSELAAPWGMLLRPSDLAHFHVIEHGGGWLRLLDGGLPKRLAEGDLVVVPHGRGHALTDQPYGDAVPLERLIPPHEPGVFPLARIGGHGPRANLICGAFAIESRPSHPLLTLLPDVIHIRATHGQTAPWLDATLRLLASETKSERPGANAVVSRLTDVLFVQALRAWLDGLADGSGGWLGALRDDRIGRAIGLMHREPERRWTVAELARAVAMSRSAFAARFTALAGEAPLAYLARWRMALAAGWLRDGDDRIGEIAERAGYQTEAAFSKAFKRWAGVAPSIYRRGEPAA